MKREFTIGEQEVRIHRASTETHGASAIMELKHPANYKKVPLHYHRYEIEHFYVLEGTYEFTIGDKTEIINSGALITAPVNTAHRFETLDAEVNRLLIFFTPGAVEKYFELMSYISEDDPDRGEKCAKLDKTFGIVMVE